MTVPPPRQIRTARRRAALTLAWLAVLWPNAPAWCGQGWRQFTEALANGELTLRLYGHAEEHPRESRDLLGELRLEQSARIDLGDRLRLMAEWEAVADNRHFSAGVMDDWSETQARRYHLNARELYALWRFEKVDLSVGKRLFAWGKAESYNPIERLNAYEFQDFLEARKLGAPSLALEAFGARGSLAFVFIPQFTPARLPREDNRWFRAPLPPPELGPLPDFAVAPRELPAAALDNAQWAVRAQGRLGPLDLAFSYYSGFDPVPVAELRLGPDPLATPVYNPIDEYGIAFVLPWSGVVLQGEAAYRVTGKGYDDDFLTYVVGFTRSWTGRSLENARFTLEFVDETLVDEAPPSARFATEFNRPFHKTLFANLSLTWFNGFTAEVKLSYETGKGDGYLQALIRRRVSDLWEIEGGVDIIEGDPDGFWGAWDANDRLFARILRRF